MDAFTGIYESRRSYKPRAKFSTYLYRIVVNLCLNAQKRRRIITHESLDDSRLSGPPDNDPARTVERHEVSHAVQDAILSLPANQRTAIVLTRYEQLSYQAAAEVMKTSVGAIESLLHRAKQNLRKSLAHLVEPR